MLRGVQTPRVRNVPPAELNEADDAAFLSASYGLAPYAWQAGVLQGWLGLRPDGRWAAPRCGLAVPRQNGKNGVLEMRELYGMVVRGERVLHTAHEVKTARKAFTRLQSFFENKAKHPELAGLVKTIRQTNGQEAIILRNGGSVEFIARSKGSGRGFTADVLVMDEAQDLVDDHLEALLPTISASPLGNPQQIMTGTPPGPKASGEVFTRTRNAGLDGDPGLCWQEWSCDGDVDLDDRRFWAQANPSLGGGLDWETVEAERSALSSDGFARERLGMWSVTSANTVIDQRTWAAAADPASRPTARLVLAVDVSPDRTSASIALASERADGATHVEVIDWRPNTGTGWLLPRLLSFPHMGAVTAVLLDSAGPAASLIPELQQARVKLLTTGVNDMKQACGAFFDGIHQRRIRHLDQPALNAALAAASKRTLQDAWAWNRRDVGDITPLVAATLAAHGVALKRKRAPATGAGRRVVVL